MTQSHAEFVAMLGKMLVSALDDAVSPAESRLAWEKVCKHSMGSTALREAMEDLPAVSAVKLDRLLETVWLGRDQ